MWLSQILVWIGRIVSNAVEAHILSYYTFSKYLSVWGKVLFNDNHKTKHRSVDSQKWHESLFQLLFPESQILWVKNKHKGLTEWLTGWNSLPLFKNIKKIKK